MYSSYQQYQQRGGNLPESEYQIKAQKASEIIDYYTMGQAAFAADMQEKLSACECELIQTAFSSGADFFAGIKSENVDGYSVTYSDRKEFEASIRKTLACYLTFPTNLLAIAGKAFV